MAWEVKLSTLNELVKQFDKLNKDTEKIMGEMTKAGAEVVAENMKNYAPDTINSHVKVSKVYKTPSNGKINTKAYVSGYLPFSDPNRKFFTRKGGSGKDYSTSKGVPIDFIANLYEYGRSTAPFPKKPFLRKSFKKKEIEEAMLKAQEKASGGLLK